MRRMLSLLLCAALLAGAAVPAAAEEAARLAAVTQAVKNALGLDTAAYARFSGSCSEELVPVWSLTWEDGPDNLYITALEDGTIVDYARYTGYTASNAGRGGLPTFPGGNEEDRAAAEAFLRRVLRPGETVDLDGAGSGGLYDNNSAWSGRIALNGLPAPLYWSLAVQDGAVSNFSRDVPEARFVGGVPSADAPASREGAAEALAGKLALKLEYAAPEDEGGAAALRYVPEEGHTFYVDAKTGDLIDADELAEAMGRRYAADAGGSLGLGNAAPSATEAEAGEDRLTEAEEAGVQELEGTLSRDALDEVLRAAGAYGLRGYALSSASYRWNGEEQLACSLRYARTDDGQRRTRTITVNAKTGEVLSVSSSGLWGREAELTKEQALERAEAFLKDLCPEREMELYRDYDDEGDRPYFRFLFARRVNGIFCPGHSYSVLIDAGDGSVYGLDYTWNDGTAFPEPEGIVSPEAAMAAWAGTFETVLAYRQIPRKLDGADPLQARLLEEGETYSYALRLTYGLEREGQYGGVDAMTGQPVRTDADDQEPLAYTDLAGSAARADIEKLAGYGVGYAAERFRPGRTLTQWELVCLLYSLQRDALDPEEAGEDDRDGAYLWAYRLGALRPAERNDSAVLTRDALARMLLDAAGFGPAARLEGIYASDYADSGDIPAESAGYAAIAQALGMCSGAYAASRAATRGEAAAMLCRLLERPA